MFVHINTERKHAQTCFRLHLFPLPLLAVPQLSGYISTPLPSHSQKPGRQQLCNTAPTLHSGAHYRVRSGCWGHRLSFHDDTPPQTLPLFESVWPAIFKFLSLTNMMFVATFENPFYVRWVYFQWNLNQKQPIYLHLKYNFIFTPPFQTPSCVKMINQMKNKNKAIMAVHYLPSIISFANPGLRAEITFRAHVMGLQCRTHSLMRVMWEFLSKLRLSK